MNALVETTSDWGLLGPKSATAGPRQAHFLRGGEFNITPTEIGQHYQIFPGWAGFHNARPRGRRVTTHVRARGTSYRTGARETSYARASVRDECGNSPFFLFFSLQGSLQAYHSTPLIKLELSSSSKWQSRQKEKHLNPTVPLKKRHRQRHTCSTHVSMYSLCGWYGLIKNDVKVPTCSRLQEGWEAMMS